MAAPNWSVETVFRKINSTLRRHLNKKACENFDV